MKPSVILASFVIGSLLLVSSAQAAVVEVDVTIKSVNAKARGITATYETKLGQKSIDLDVSRKAEITVNGKSGTLASSDRARRPRSLTRKNLQVVTKIIATGEGTAPGREVYRLTLQISEFGDGKVRMEKDIRATQG